VDPDDPNEKDSPPLRWAGFASIIIVLAVVGGVVGALWAYVDLFNSKSVYHYSAVDYFKRDTWSAMKWRFVVGAAVGGMGGVVYLVRCLRHGEDP
jgi:hypothetical protein